MRREIQEGDECECGNPATVLKGHSRICARCAMIEERMAHVNGGSYSQIRRVAKRKPNLMGQVIEPYRVAIAGIV